MTCCSRLRRTHNRLLAVFLLSLLTGAHAWGQFFVVDGAPCPGGDNITLDTLTYSPDKAMPFDRCFYLKATLPGNQSVKAFGIAPIDKKGNPKSSRRDYRVFLRSGWPAGEARRTARRSMDYVTAFRHHPIKRQFTDVKTTSNDKKTEVVLRVPPLEPGREYRIILIGEDADAFKDVLEIGELLIESQQTSNAALLSQAKQKHLKSSTKSNSRMWGTKPTPFDPLGLREVPFELYEQQLTSFKLMFNLNKGGAEKSYRVFFSPLFSPINSAIDAERLGKNLSINIKEAISPQTVNVTLPVETSNGGTLQPFQQGVYVIQVLTFFIDGTPPSLTDLGTLMIHGNGLLYTFAPNPSIANDVYVEFKEQLLSQFKIIHETKTKLQNMSSQPEDCLNDKTLDLLLTEAVKCPCEEKGIKDLTQKNDLLRMISVLHLKDSTLNKNLWQGFVSMKNPAAEPLKPQDYVGRVSALKDSQTQLNDLIEFARKIATYHPQHENAVRVLLNCLEKWQTQFSSAIGLMETMLDTRSTLKSELTEPLGLKQTRPLAIGSTTALNLLSDTKFRIMPDFGFVALFKGDKLYTFQDFTPYLGFQVGLRSMDKNIPFRMIRYKSIWHRLSVMSGVTLRSLKIENQREDFFGSNSLITGLGFRLSSYVRATGGAVWFKAVDPNRLTNNKPIRFSPFVGVSIDLDVQELFGGITKLFK